MGNHIRILRFQKTYPARTAGGEHRHFLLLIMVQSFQKFTGLLHEGKIRCKIRIENIISTHSAKGISQLFNRCLFPTQPERFPPRGTDSRSNLHNGNFIRIVKCRKGTLAVFAHMQGIHRTMCDTLSA